MSSSWWLKAACLFFFAGLACYIPLLHPHLRWLGFNLMEKAIVSAISITGGMLALAVVAGQKPQCGSGSRLAVAGLLAALSCVGLSVIPRLSGRLVDSSPVEEPVAEIFCRPEGSALFFRKCGPSCQLGSVTRTELAVSDCRFEDKSALPEDVLEWINRFGVPSGSSLNGIDDDDESEPERGDLPRKVPDDDVHQPHSPHEEESDPTKLDASLDYDYEENHRHEYESSDKLANVISEDDGRDDSDGSSTTEKKRKRDVDEQHESQFQGSLPFDGLDLINIETGYTSSPHICFSTYATSTTTCHVFTGTNHLFRFNTSLYSGITYDDYCFYSLNYDDVDNQILSELRCRSNNPSQQVRCKADGIKLKSSPSNNETCRIHQPPKGNYYYVFALYVVVRTVGEIGIVAGLVMLRLITLKQENDRTLQVLAQRTATTSFAIPSSVRWWLWSLVGHVLAAPLSGWVASVSGSSAAFLLGAVMFGLVALCVAVSPHHGGQEPRHPVLEATLAVIDEDLDDSVKPKTYASAYRIVGRGMAEVIGAAPFGTLFTLLLVAFLGTAESVVLTVFQRYLFGLGVSQLVYGISVALQWTVAAPFVLLCSRWLWKRCGHQYIFIIGLLLYSIRFLGYTMLHDSYLLMALEVLEPFASVWMLLTAVARFDQLTEQQVNQKPWRFDGHGINDDVDFAKIHSWLWIAVFYVTIGRALGTATSYVATHFFGEHVVFAGSGSLCVAIAAVWFLWIHTKRLCAASRNRTRHHMNSAVHL